MSYTDLVDKLPALLSVDASYKESVIPTLLTNAIRRLLRDYNFPQSLAREEFPIVAGEVSYALPLGFKRDLSVVLHEKPDLYGEPLLKREGIVARSESNQPEYYWFEGSELRLNTAHPNTEANAFVVLFYQSQDPEINADWLCDEFEDCVLSLTMYRAASVLRKPELAQGWGPIWAEDQRSLAIYTHELEFDNSEILMNAARTSKIRKRYPAAGEA